MPDGHSPEVDRAKRSYLALSKVLDILKWSNQACSANDLKVAIEVHMRARLAAYGPGHFQPKCHYMGHLSSILQKHRLLCCWVHERKHKELKRFASDSSNANLTAAYETGLLKQVVLTQIHALKDFSIGETCRLIKPQEMPDHFAPLYPHVRQFLNMFPGMPVSIQTSSEALLDSYAKCSAKDVVLATLDGAERVGEVWCFLRAVHADLVLWSPWTALGGNRFRVVNEPELMKIEHISRSCTYFKEDASTCVVVP